MKYKLTDETKQIGELTLHRIEALKDFSDVEAGAKGGWIEGERNLSHNGDAKVSGDVWVSGDVELFSGECFASQGGDWDVTKIPCGDDVLLVRGYTELEKENDDATKEALELLKSKGYRIVKD